MSSNPCTPESIVMTKYCRIRLCPDCSMVHFDLPYRVSFQFDSEHFLGMVDAFMQAGHIIRKGQQLPEEQLAPNVVKIGKFIN